MASNSSKLEQAKYKFGTRRICKGNTKEFCTVQNRVLVFIKIREVVKSVIRL